MSENEPRKHRPNFGIEALDRLRSRRVSNGVANNERSRKPGLTILLTDEGIEAIAQSSELEGPPLLPDQINQLPSGLFVLDFPNGVYQTGGGAIQIHREVREDWKPTGGIGWGEVALAYEHVVFMRDRGGAIWFNNNFRAMTKKRN